MRSTHLSKIHFPFVVVLSLVAACLPVQGQTPAAAINGPSFPNTGMVYTLGPDNALVQIHGTEIKLNSHVAGNFARSMVYAGPESTVELPGLTAPVMLSSTTPVLYVRLSNDDPDIVRKRVMLISLTPTKSARVLMSFTANVFGGHRKRHFDEVLIAKMDSKDALWLKVTPAAALEPGQYAIAVVPKDANSGPDVVYDFGIPGTAKPRE